MAKCDKCEYEGPTVIMGDHCPECNQLVGFPVPGGSSTAAVLKAYDSEASDAALGEAVKAVAQRNYATLLRRKRKSELEAGLNTPAPQPEAGGTDSPPNAEPAAATDPSVQPQPDGATDDSAGGSEAEADTEADQLDGEESAGV